MQSSERVSIGSIFDDGSSGNIWLCYPFCQAPRRNLLSNHKEPPTTQPCRLFSMMLRGGPEMSYVLLGRLRPSSVFTTLFPLPPINFPETLENVHVYEMFDVHPLRMLCFHREHYCTFKSVAIVHFSIRPQY